MRERRREKGVKQVEIIGGENDKGEKRENVMEAEGDEFRKGMERLEESLSKRGRK